LFNQTPRALLKWQRAAALLLALSLLAGTAFGWQAAAVATAPAATLSDAERAAVALVRAESIRETTAALSAPEMQGRGTGQPGGERAAQFIAERYRQLGLKPAGEKGTYFQTIKFREFHVAPDSQFTLDGAPLRMGDEFAAMPPHSGDEDLSGRVVFVGFGIRNKARDDFKNIDVRGKVVVLVSGPPRGVTEKDWKKMDAPLQIARNLVMSGAAALVLTNTGTEQTPYAMLADYLTRRQLELADEEQPPRELPPFVAVSDAAAEKLFNGSGTTYADAFERANRGEHVSRELKPAAKIKIKFKDARVTGSNVSGLLEGADPKLKEEAVVYTAHYDAWGAGPDGRVFHGAADNALGVAEMLAVAEAFAKSAAKPRRSVIFLAVTGEEHGLYGAEHWTKNPTWKIKQVAANFNFDGMGTEIHGPLKKAVGFGAEHSDLGAVLQAAAAASNVEIVPDPMPEERAFVRSDHYAFVKRGVPALMLLGAPDVPKEKLIDLIKEYQKKAYHLPGDTVSEGWNWEGPRGLAQLGLVVGMRVANADAMPAWLPTSPYNRERGTNKPPPQEP
jgi:hypothetical protein